VGVVTLHYYNPSFSPSVGAFDFYLTSSVVKPCGLFVSFIQIFNSHTSCCGNPYGYRGPTQTPIMFDILNTCTVCMRGWGEGRRAG